LAANDAISPGMSETPESSGTPAIFVNAGAALISDRFNHVIDGECDACKQLAHSAPIPIASHLNVRRTAVSALCGRPHHADPDGIPGEVTSSQWNARFVEMEMKANGFSGHGFISITPTFLALKLAESPWGSAGIRSTAGTELRGAIGRALHRAGSGPMS